MLPISDCELDGRHYVIIVDHYSDFIDMDELTSTTSNAVIMVM